MHNYKLARLIAVQARHCGLLISNCTCERLQITHLLISSLVCPQNQDNNMDAIAAVSLRKIASFYDIRHGGVAAWLSPDTSLSREALAVVATQLPVPVVDTYQSQSFPLTLAPQ
jgi:hypothetical protein